MTPIIQYQGELHQFLRAVAQALDPYANLIWRLGAAGYLFALTFGAVRATGGSPARLRPWESEPVFVTVLLGGLVLLRLPSLLFHELNPDESQWIASAATLVADPRIWISVDPTTSGPLNVYPLMLPYVFGLSLDYATLRLTGLLLGWVPTLGLLYAAFRTYFGGKLARLAALLPAMCLSLMQIGDGVAYNSEHFPSALLALSLLLLVRLAKNRTGSWGVFALGFVLGCVPYTKLQAVPPALILAMVGLFLVWKNRRKGGVSALLPYLVGGLAPTGLVLAYVWAVDGWTVFYHSFILANLGYAQTGSFGHGVESWPEKLSYLLPLLYTALPSTAGFYRALPFLVLLGAGLFFSKRLPADRLWLFGLSVAWLLTAVYASLQTGNRFPHYQFIAFVPAFWLAGVTFHLAIQAANHRLHRSLRWLWAIGLALWPGLSLAWQGNGMLSMLRAGKTAPLPYPALVAAIRAQSRPDEKMVVWGWLNRLHVETGLLLGSRFIPLYYPVVPGEWQPYFMQLHETDIRRNRPRIFVDTTPLFPAYAPFTPDRYPGIRKLLAEEYRFAGVYDGARLYVLTPGRSGGKF